MPEGPVEFEALVRIEFEALVRIQNLLIIRLDRGFLKARG